MKQRTAWVTGGSGGIGSAISIELAKAGYDVAVSYGQNEAAAKQVVEACREYGVSSYAFQLHLTEDLSFQRVLQNIRLHLSDPSIFVHAAGNHQYGLIQEITEPAYNEIMDTHVKSSIFLIQSILPSMLQQQYGRIVLISSIWGSLGGAGEVLYSTAKAAMNGLTKALAQELAPSGITVNAVAPGAITTKMLDQQLTKDEQIELCEEIPMGRLGTPNEIASMVRFLCSEEAGYTTGQIFHVNGGWFPSG